MSGTQTSSQCTFSKTPPSPVCSCFIFKAWHVSREVSKTFSTHLAHLSRFDKQRHCRKYKASPPLEGMRFWALGLFSPYFWLSLGLGKTLKPQVMREKNAANRKQTFNSAMHSTNSIVKTTWIENKPPTVPCIIQQIPFISKNNLDLLRDPKRWTLPPAISTALSPPGIPLQLLFGRRLGAPPHL